MNPIVRGVLAYEDVSIAKLAKEKWDYMVRSLKKSYEFELRLWKFDALRILELSEAAVKDAANAQMVFIAMHGAGQLPPEVKAWMGQWLVWRNQKREATRLLLLLCDAPTGPVEASAFSQFAYLQQAARKGSMDFIAAGLRNQSQPTVTRLHAPVKRMRSWEDNRWPTWDLRTKREMAA